MPDEYVASIYDIDLNKLWSDGRRLILTDLDNTLVPWNHPHIDDALANWFDAARLHGFSVCIVSNNQAPRVRAFAELAGIPYVAAARKPKPRGFVEAMTRFRQSPETTVMVGDQLLTDIRGGNRAGLYTILVLPIDSTEWWGTRILRRIERVLMKRLVRRGLVVPQRKEVPSH